MPVSEIRRLTRTTARGFLARNPEPKFKYIEDPADVVSLTYKNQFSQYNMKYHEYNLAVSPIFGCFSGQRVSFNFDWDTLKVTVDNNLAYVMVLRIGTSPEKFIRFCLNFLYSSDAENILSEHQINSNEIKARTTEETNHDTPASLVVQCLRSAVINIASMPGSQIQCLPIHYQEHLAPESFLLVTFNLWPRHVRGERTILAVKNDMVISEVLLLLRQKLKLRRHLRVHMFRNCLPVEDDDILQTKDVVYDCVFSEWRRGPVPTGISREKVDLRQNFATVSNKDVIVASLVGSQIKDVFINLSLPLRFLDKQLRQTFRLKPWSFLVMYLPCDNRSIFYAGRVIYTSFEEEFVKFLISNGRRNFPKPDKGIETLSINEMYKECSVFKKSLRCLGFQPGTLVEVFEITGPSIPVMYSGAVTKAQVIDVNPDWSLQTFLYYIRVNTPQASKIESIDYVKDCNKGKVSDLLEMMKNLWNRPDDGSRLEYLRLRS